MAIGASVQRPERLAQRQRVDQRLGRMRVHAVAGVDDRHAGRARGEVRRAGCTVAEDDAS